MPKNQDNATESPASTGWGTACCTVLGFALIAVIFHVNSFTIEHVEGDEVAYLALGEEMGWDFSHYTTANHPIVKQFPYTFYHNPVFLHPPLLPYVLKIGGALGSAVATGLAFQLGAAILSIILAWWAGGWLGLGRRERTALAGAMTLCPILLFSTTKLHVDGLMAIFMFGGILVSIRGWERKSGPLSLLAGLLWALAFNTKFTMVAMLPVLVMLLLFCLWRTHKPGERWFAPLQSRQNWICISATLIPLLLLGWLHHYRLIMEYGMIGTMNVVKGNRYLADNPSAFTEGLIKRNRLHLLIHVLSIWPIVLVFLAPSWWKKQWHYLREKRWEGCLPILLIYVAGLFIWQHQLQMRYLAPAFPLFYLILAIAWRDATPKLRTAMTALGVISAILMLTTGYTNTIMFPENARLFPALFFYLPFLQPLFA